MNRRLIYIFLSAGLALILVDISQDNIQGSVTNIVERTSLAPYAYRILAPYALYVPMRLSPFAALWAYWFVCLSLLALLTDEVARTWYPNPYGRIVTMLAVIAPMTRILPAGAFWNILEGVFFALALVLIIQHRDAWLIPLVLVATLNRETAVFIPVMYFLVTRNWKHTTIQGVVWFSTYAAIRLWIGPMPLHLTLADIALRNFSVWGLVLLVLNVVLFGWVAVKAWQGYKAAPQVLRRAAWVIPPYLLALAVFGVLWEVRLLFTVFPILFTLFNE